VETHKHCPEGWDGCPPPVHKALLTLVHPVAASLLALAYIFAFVAAGVYND